MKNGDISLLHPNMHEYLFNDNKVIPYFYHFSRNIGSVHNLHNKLKNADKLQTNKLKKKNTILILLTEAQSSNKNNNSTYSNCNGSRF